jgi:hypothetical protein
LCVCVDTRMDCGLCKLYFVCNVSSVWFVLGWQDPNNMLIHELANLILSLAPWKFIWILTWNLKGNVTGFNIYLLLLYINFGCNRKEMIPLCCLQKVTWSKRWWMMHYMMLDSIMTLLCTCALPLEMAI